jgi:hypothetical protein
MGHEIVYCASCQCQLRGSDFEKGKAGRVANQSYCSDCLARLALTPDAAAAKEPVAPAPAAARPAPTARHTASDRGPSAAVVGAIVAVLVVILGLAALTMTSTPTRPSVSAPTEPPAPVARVEPPAPPPPPRPEPRPPAPVETPVPKEPVAAPVPPPPPEPKPDLSAEANPKPAKAEPPKPAPPVDADPLRGAWDEALAAARGREYDRALQRLDAAVAKAPAGPARSEIEANAQSLRTAGALHAEAAQILAKLSRGHRLALSYWDPAGAVRKVEAVVLRNEAFRLELKGDKEPLTVPHGEVLPATLVELVAARRGRKPEAELFLSLEGDDGAAAGREKAARDLFYAAEAEFPGTFAKANAAIKYRKLLADFAGSAFVARNRGAIAARVDAGREYVVLFEDLRATVSFRASSGAVGPFWTTDAESEAARKKDSYVEFEVSLLPDAEYKAWVLVGACCQESLAFWVAEPDGSVGEEPVAHGLAATTKTHASHGGRKPPARWGWVEIPLPRPAAGGTLRPRVVTHHQGFAVAGAVVSAGRAAPPREVDLREAEKARGIAGAAASRAQDRLRPGLLGEYFVLDQLPKSFPAIPAGQKPALKRVDAQIHWEATANKYLDTEYRENFYVRWTGLLKVPKDGKYTFLVASDDGSRVWIDGQLLVDHGGIHPMTTKSGSA